MFSFHFSCNQVSMLVTAPGGRMTAPLTNHGKTLASTITIRSEEVVDNKESITLHLAADRIPKPGFFFKAHTLIVISRSVENGEWVPIYRSEVVDGPSPVWKVRKETENYCV
jgi:hypothetical protein